MWSVYMLLKVFAVYDSGAGFYGQPVFAKSKGEFLRSFVQAANDSQCPIGKYPQDFTAFELGSFDDATASFDLLSTPVSLGKAIEYVKSESQRIESLDQRP